MQVNDNGGDNPATMLSVAVAGVEMTQWPDCFVWGAFVAPLAQPGTGGADDDDELICEACSLPIRDGDLVLADVNCGLMHGACCGPERESYVGADGEPLKDGEPIPVPWPYRAALAPQAEAGEG